MLDAACIQDDSMPFICWCCTCMQEFTAVHRMHSLLPESFTLTNVDGTQMGTMWTRDTLLKGARDVMVSQI